MSNQQEIDEVLMLVGHDLKLEKIDVRKEIEPELPPIIVDRRQLQEVLFNLLRNAAEACQGRPNPRVALEALVLDAFIKIEVKDNGKGMDDALLARLFEPFFSTKGSAGTGLGLFISRKVIELHGGRIEVSSKVGEGTTFAVLLPREAVKQEGLVEQGR